MSSPLASPALGLDEKRELGSTPLPSPAIASDPQHGRLGTAALRQLRRAEWRGIQPVSEDERTSTAYGRQFLFWFSANFTIACLSVGTLGPLLYGLDLGACAGVIFGFSILSCACPAYLSTFGPKTGLRQMTIARWSFGYVPVVLPTILNMAGMLCFCLLNAIVGGQTLVAASQDGNLTIDAGIIIVALCALGIAFAGVRALHIFETYAWIPVLVAFAVLAGTANSQGQLSDRGDLPPATAANVLSFASLIVGWTLSWSPLASDFFVYLSPAVPSWKVFASTFFGLYLSCAPVQFIGAAIMLAAPQQQSWIDAYNANSIGGLVGQIFYDYGLGRFGSFLLVVFGLGMIMNNAPTIYAWSLNAQVLVPFLLKVPRFLMVIVATAIYLPLAIVGSSAYVATLNSFTGLLGYWSAPFVSVLVVEHLLIRRRDFSQYRQEDFNSFRRLPPGIAALISCIVAAGVLVTGIDQVWFRGPIAKAITGDDEIGYGGDIGFELGLAVTILVFAPLRLIEYRIFKR